MNQAHQNTLNTHWQKLPPLVRDTILILSLACISYLGASVGKLLAIPPGNVTPLWPPSGIALTTLLLLGKRYWPATLLGSFCFNAMFFYTQTHQFLENDLLCSLCIAIGSTLQALLGYFLAKKVAQYDTQSWHAASFFKAMLLSGPLSCIIAASIGAISLTLLKGVPTSNLPNIWITWWFGDTTGVIILGSLILSIKHYLDDKESSPIDSQRTLGVLLTSLTLGILICGTLWIWYLLRFNIESENKARFEHIVQRYEQVVRTRLFSYQDALNGGKGLIEATGYPTETQWKQYVSNLNIQQRYPGLWGIGYIQCIKKNKLKAHERKSRQTVNPEFTIHSFPNFVAPNDDRYIIQYIEPHNKNSRAQGLDIGSEERRRKAIEEARDTGLPTLTDTIHLVQDKGPFPGFLLFIPVYQQNSNIENLSVIERRDKFIGAVYAPFNSFTIFKNIIPTTQSEVAFSVDSLNKLGQKERLYQEGITISGEERLTIQHTFQYGSKTLFITWQTTPHFDRLHSSHQPAVILILSLLSSILLAALILNLHSTKERALVLAKRTTEEIESQNQLLDELNHLETMINELMLFDTRKTTEEFLAFVVEKICTLTHWQVGHICIPLADGSIQSSSTWYIEQSTAERYQTFKENRMNMTFSLGKGFPGKVAEHRAPIWVEDISCYEPFIQRQDVIQVGLKSAYGFPLIIQDKLVAILEFYTEKSSQSAEHIVNICERLQNAVSRAFLKRQQQQELETSEARLKLALEASQQGLWEWNILNNTLHFDATCLSLLHLENAQACICAEEFVKMVHPEDYQHIKKTIASYLKQGAQTLQKQDCFEIEFRFQFAKKQEAHSSQTETAWFFAKGKLIQNSAQNGNTPNTESFEKEAGKITTIILGTLQNIQERKKAESILKHSQQQAEQASKLKSEFLATMSHEIRTPMNGILGMTDIALHDNTISTEQRQHLEVIRSSGESLLVIINDILDFSKIEAGKLSIETRPFSLIELIQETAAPFQAAAQSKALQFTVTHQVPSDMRYQGDRVRIKQILNNLLGNAFKFTEQGSISLTVEQKAFPSEQTDKPLDTQLLYFSVKDTGIGLTQEQQERLFQPFTQGDGSTSRKYGGTGLGLSICKQLCELMQGSIGFTSNRGEGSEFYFSIPITPIHEVATSPVLQSISAQELASLGMLNILLVEDNKINQKVAQKMLNQMGHKVTLADNGRIALDILNAATFDLILMDIQMPELDGYQTTQLIREKEKQYGGHIPIIALTANAISGDREHCIQAGMDDYLSKPFKLESLSAVIQTVLNQPNTSAQLSG